MMDAEILRAMFFRSFLLQSCWSFAGRQNLGFLFALEPLLRRLYPERDEFSRAAMRHLACFNTQPYMSGFALGVVGRMERERAALKPGEREAQDKKIDRMKASLSAALAAMGDSFFWGTLRPACAAATLLVWLVLWTARAPHPIFWGLLFYLASYNAVALWARRTGLARGFAAGAEVVEELERMNWRAKTRAVRRGGLAALAFVIAAAWLVAPWGGAAGWRSAAVFSAAFFLRGRGWTAAKTYAWALALGTAGALAAA